MTMPVAVFMALVALAAAPHHHARLAPSNFEPLQVRGTGFRAYERVRVTVTASAGEPISHRVRATRRGVFVVSFAGVEACGGIEGVAAGSRGSHASFQSSSLTC
jgi:hypothetical protein